VIRRTLAHLLATATLATMAACGGSAPAAAPASAGRTPDVSGVTLNWAVQADATRSLLEASGQLADTPYRINWSHFDFGPPIVEALGAGRVDLGLVGSTPPIFGAAAQTNFRVVATVALRNHLGAAILVKNGSPLSSVADLKGKKVAVPKGSNAHGLLLTALHRAGLGPDDVSTVFLPPPDAVTAFGRGDVDAVALWEPYLTLAGPNARRLAGGPPDEVGDTFELASTAALADPAKAAAIRDALHRLSIAIAWGNDHPDGFAAAWSAESSLPLDTVRAALPQMLRDLLAVDTDTITAEQTLADRLFDDGVIPRKVDFSAIVEPGLLDAAPATPSPTPSAS
jgi:sulfonate transport system substrate-binding protein